MYCTFDGLEDSGSNEFVHHMKQLDTLGHLLTIRPLQVWYPAVCVLCFNPSWQPSAMQALAPPPPVDGEGESEKRKKKPRVVG